MKSRAILMCLAILQCATGLEDTAFSAPTARDHILLPTPDEHIVDHHALPSTTLKPDHHALPSTTLKPDHHALPSSTLKPDQHALPSTTLKPDHHAAGNDTVFSEEANEPKHRHVRTHARVTVNSTQLPVNFTQIEQLIAQAARAVAGAAAANTIADLLVHSAEDTFASVQALIDAHPT